MEKAIAKRAVAMIPVMVARDSVTAEQGILLLSVSISLSSSFFLSFPISSRYVLSAALVFR